jgi:hypothetical protein
MNVATWNDTWQQPELHEQLVLPSGRLPWFNILTGRLEDAVNPSGHFPLLTMHYFDDLSVLELEPAAKSTELLLSTSLGSWVGSRRSILPLPLGSRLWVSKLILQVQLRTRS